MRTNTLRIVGLAAMLLLATVVFAQNKRETFGATAMGGEGPYFGKTFNVTIIVEQYSTVEDQQILLQAFNTAGNQGLVNALNKMPAKGHIAITGTLGYDVTYVREFPMPNGGRRIRLVTNRPITMGEMWTDSRSQDYNLSALELIISPDKNQSGGTLLPACQFSITKEKELSIDALQSPWKLVDIIVW
ncbi:MAG TPA: hypothetical protein VE825_14105 [Terriglobales bacterium]|nr:hypothetical protein [Terriglobales bacterium]